MAAIYPSLISGDLLNLAHELNRLSPWSAGFHIDVMDNHFVPNLTWGPAFVNALEKASPKPLCVHLMVDNPEKMIDSLTLRSGSTLSFHLESIEEISRIILAIKEKKWRVSIAIKPKTPLERLWPFLDMIDQVLLMSVEPGFSGQQFLPTTFTRLERLTKARSDKKLSFKIALDGGINADNIAQLVALGADEFAVAKGIFGSANPVAALKELNDIANETARRQ